MNTRSSIDAFLSQPSLAVVGASRSGRRFGNTVVRTLARKGYDVVVVHPEADEIDGHRCCRSLAELPHPVGGLVLVVPPAQTAALIPQAEQAGIRRIWMQQGSESAPAIDDCRARGIDVVHGACVLMYAQPEGVHRLHRWIMDLLHKVPAQARP